MQLAMDADALRPSVGIEDYGSAYDGFEADAVLDRIFSADRGSVNAATVCCDRHAGDGARIALRHRKADGTVREWSFRELRDASIRFAEVLAANGVRRGERVAGLLPRTPELLITILAAWRIGAVYQPLFTAFGPKAVEYRVAEAKTRFVVTDEANREKLSTLPKDIPVAVIGGGHGAIDFWRRLESSPGRIEPAALALDDPMLMMFTSGTTGPAKPLLVPIRAIAAFANYNEQAIGLRSGDRFWNIADPGWAYGLYYAITAPLALGIATTFYEGPFTAASTYETIEALGIDVLAGSPTAFRMLMAAGAPARLKGRLRAVSSAGEPLNPQVIRWFDEELGTVIHDHYGQTEIGMVVCNHHGLRHSVRPGTAGFAVPGHRVTVVGEGGEERGIGEPGILALDRTRSPLMWFSGYHERPTSAFVGDYYLSGDTVERNPDGSISFVGRSDDVITTSGYRVGPFEVESALIEHPAVQESAVVGKPDPERTEIVKAFVVLNDGARPGKALEEELQAFVKTRLSAHSYPREIEFVDALPKTPSGKLQRFVLRRQEQDKVAGPGAR